jgi:hypothetical protein
MVPKALRWSGLVAMRAALAASVLAWLTAAQPSAPVVLMLASVSPLSELWARRIRSFPAEPTVPEWLPAAER